MTSGHEVGYIWHCGPSSLEKAENSTDRGDVKPIITMSILSYLMAPNQQFLFPVWHKIFGAQKCVRLADFINFLLFSREYASDMQGVRLHLKINCGLKNHLHNRNSGWMKDVFSILFFHYGLAP